MLQFQSAKLSLYITVNNILKNRFEHQPSFNYLLFYNLMVLLVITFPFDEVFNILPKEETGYAITVNDTLPSRATKNF